MDVDLGRCLPANPDVSGIGVRTAIYAQNFLTFIPAVYAISDQIVTQKELESVKAHSTTILLTAFALLISAYVQVWSKSLTNYHTAVVLSLSWMNNTNAVVYALLYIHHNNHIFLSWTNLKQHLCSLLRPVEWHTHGHTVFSLGSLHLTLMSVLGLWLWTDIKSFGKVTECDKTPIFSVLGKPLPLTSPFLRVLSLTMYGIVTIPFVNLALPMAVGIASYALWNRKCRPQQSGVIHKPPSIWPIGICLGAVFAINIIFLIDTELTLSRNKSIQQPGEALWSFGQSLALTILFQPLWDLSKSVWHGLNLDLKIRKHHDAEEALKHALLNEDLDMVAVLVPKVPEIDTLTGGRFATALQLAAYYGDSNLTKLLLANRVDVNKMGGINGCALQAAAYRGHLEIVDTLLSHKADVTLEGGEFGSAIQAAAFAGNVDILERLLSCEPTLDYSKHIGLHGTPLHAAVCSESENALEMLLKYKHFILQDLEARDRPRYRPKTRQRRYIAQDVQSPTERTEPSPVAFRAESLPSRNSLLSPTDLPEGPTRLDIIRLARNNPANFVKDKSGKTLFHVACERGLKTMAKILVEKYYADVNSKDEDGFTVLHTACRTGNVAIVELLFEMKADVNEVSRSRMTWGPVDTCIGPPLAIACKHNHVETARILIRHGADVNFHLPSQEVYSDHRFMSVNWAERTERDGSPLHIACRNNHIEMVKLLLQHEAIIVNARTEFKMTPLHYACENSNFFIAELLVSANADVNMEDFGGATPLEIAQEIENDQLIHLLQRHGAERRPQDTRVGRRARRQSDDASFATHYSSWRQSSPRSTSGSSEARMPASDASPRRPPSTASIQMRSGRRASRSTRRTRSSDEIVRRRERSTRSLDSASVNSFEAMAHLGDAGSEAQPA
ncbi:ankyrin repeat-containing domain protein [Mycena rebaudengoi]|nr:ankyrin repeat-containing domain protein [Mycena rebaudengoi]